MKSIEELKASAQGSMNQRLLSLDIPLRLKGQFFGRDESKSRAPFPNAKGVGGKNGKINFLIHMLPVMGSMFGSVIKSVRLTKKLSLKKHSQSIDKVTFDQMIKMMKSIGIDQIGYVEITEQDVFKDLGVPYQHVLIFTARQNNAKIQTSPSIDSQVEVARIYGITGIASNKTSVFLEKQGFGAMPGHSLGGSVDYTKLGWKAGLGEIGRHGLLIEPISGPNHRLGAVFTNIENLGSYFETREDHSWIKEFCAKCGKCIRKCPANAILENVIVDDLGFTTSIEYKKCHPEFGDKWGCNICVKECPFTTVGYEKLKSRFIKIKSKI